MRRAVAVAALCAMSAGPAGCYRWVPVSQATLRAGTEEVRLRDVRFTAGEERVVLHVHRVNYPSVDGWSADRRQEFRLDAARYDEIAVRRINGPATAGLVLGMIPVAAVVVGLGVLVVGLSSLR